MNGRHVGPRDASRARLFFADEIRSKDIDVDRVRYYACGTTVSW